MGRDIISCVSGNVVRVDVRVGGVDGNGSGIVVDENGSILTCEHVVRPRGVIPESLRVTKGDGDYFEPTVETLDPAHDVAILRANQMSGTVDIGSYEEVSVGDSCFVLGFPVRLPHMAVIRGTISAKGRNLVSGFPFDLIQVDARINSGNSGGPVIDAQTGKVIGIVSMKYIPFLTEVNELRRFVTQIPVAPTGQIALGGVDWGAFFNYVNESSKRITQALMLVQVGIGWVVPIRFFSGSLPSR